MTKEEKHRFNEWWDNLTKSSDQWTTLERLAAYDAWNFQVERMNQRVVEELERIKRWKEELNQVFDSELRCQAAAYCEVEKRIKELKEENK